MSNKTPKSAKVLSLSSLTSDQGSTFQGFSNYILGEDSIAGIGDFNKDGYDDFAIGVSGASPNGKAQAGQSYVILGQKASYGTVDLQTFTSGSRGFIIQGSYPSDNCGSNLYAGGDVNNDGYYDLMVSVLSATYQPFDFNNVIFGKGSGFSTIDLASFPSSSSDGFTLTGSGHQYTSTGVGDTNNDGYDDFITGFYLESPYTGSNAGQVHMVLGRANWTDAQYPSTPSDTEGFTIYGAAQNERLGTRVSAVGDFNGDGFKDILISTNIDKSYVLFGKANGLSNVDLSTFTSGTNGFIIYGGYSFSAAGDFNDDGYDDIIIGDGGYTVFDKYGAGASCIIFGKAIGFTDVYFDDIIPGNRLSSGFPITGAVADDASGSYVSAAGDFNNDGVDDVIIGAPNANQGLGNTGTGEAYIIFGKKDGLEPIDLAKLDDKSGIIIRGKGIGDYCGAKVSAAGDVNNDGFGDVLINAPSFGEDGKAETYLIYGDSYGPLSGGASNTPNFLCAALFTLGAVVLQEVL